LAVAREKIETDAPRVEENREENYGLESMVLRRDSRFAGKSIRQCGLREEVRGLVVGIEREGQRMLNPDSSFILNDLDRLWIVGDVERIRKLASSESGWRSVPTVGEG
jgi:CPA2 family monovalent cation:H+ antiporter-2